MHRAASRPFLQPPSLLLRDKLGPNVPCKETFLKKINRSSPTGQHSYFRNEAGLGQCVERAELFLEERESPKPQLCHLPGTELTLEWVLAPLEGDQELAGRSEAGPHGQGQWSVGMNGKLTSCQES